MALKIDRTATTIMRFVGWVITILILACFTKVYIWERSYYKQQSVSPRADAVAVITKLPELKNIDTSKVDSEQYSNYQTEAAAPRYLKIERLKVNAIVAKGSVSNDGQLQYPNNIFEVSWYAGSSNPGSNGAIIISGISHFDEHSGQFSSLDSLETDDKIVIVSGDGNEYSYSVKSVSICSKKDAETVLPKAEQRLEGKETLSLVSIGDGDDSFVVVRATIDK